MINILTDINSVPGSGGTIPVSVIYENAPVSGISAAHTDYDWITVEAMGIYPPTGTQDHTISYNITIDPNSGLYRVGSVVFRYTDASANSYTAYMFIYQGTSTVIKTSIYKDTFFEANGSSVIYSIVHNGEPIFNGKTFRNPDDPITYINVAKIARDYIYQSLGDFREYDDDVIANEGGSGMFSLVNEYGAALANYEFLYQYEGDWNGETEYNMSEPINGHLDVRMKMMATIYEGGVMPYEPVLTDYLTFTITSSGYINWKQSHSESKTIEYRKNGGEWTSITTTKSGNRINVVSGDVLEFRGDNDKYAYLTSKWGFQGSTAGFHISGNIMSLISSTNFDTLNTFTSTYVFSELFSACTELTSAENLILPVMSLTEYCYYDMFSDCNKLTKAPRLSANTLAKACYSFMFRHCSSLTTAPVLPATTLADECYCCMFDFCTSLTTAPSLPATTLASDCYSSMFRGCNRLTTAPELPATTLETNCYAGMFDGCTRLTTAPDLPATQLADECYHSMFRDCTSLTTAPDLPATTLADECYFQMFDFCSSLNYVKCLATDLSATDCTHNWLRNVKSTGTFVKDASMSSWSTGNNGIPSGWTVINA